MGSAVPDLHADPIGEEALLYLRQFSVPELVCLPIQLTLHPCQARTTLRIAQKKRQHRYHFSRAESSLSAALSPTRSLPPIPCKFLVAKADRSPERLFSIYTLTGYTTIFLPLYCVDHTELVLLRIVDFVSGGLSDEVGRQSRLGYR